MTIRAERSATDGGRGHRYAVMDEKGPVSVATAMQRLRDSASFRSWFAVTLAEAPFGAYRWECPPMTRATSGTGFEFVVVDSPALDTEAEPQAFAEYFGAGAGDIAAFDNLGGDARLIVPTPQSKTASYSHLAAFLRTAPSGQVDALWHAVGQAACRRVGRQPLWLSTAGTGVAWLHVRFDARPKYYVHAPYRIWPNC